MEIWILHLCWTHLGIRPLLCCRSPNCLFKYEIVDLRSLCAPNDHQLTATQTNSIKKPSGTLFGSDLKLLCVKQQPSKPSGKCLK